MNATTPDDAPPIGVGDRADAREVVTEHNGVRVTGARRHTIDLHSLTRALLMVCEDMARKQNEKEPAGNPGGKSKDDPNGSDVQMEG